MTGQVLNRVQEDAVRRRPLSSSYSTAFLPMREGTRTRLWREGFDQRNSRKQRGCTHDKIEWDVITARDEEMFEKKFEELQLPTSRLVRRRRHLDKVYQQERKRALNKKHDLLKKNLSVEDAGLIAERNQNEYEKNKARARKANIQFPTPIPTVRSSRSSSALRSSSARVSREKSALPGPSKKRNSSSREPPLKDLQKSLEKLSIKAKEDPKHRKASPLHMDEKGMKEVKDMADSETMKRYLEMKSVRDLDQCAH